MVNKIVTGAHYGLKDWLVQRVTALIMAVYTLLFATICLVCCPTGYSDWVAIFQPLWMRFATLLFFFSLFWHAWIGVRDIYMDYVKPTALRLALQIVTVLLLILYALWAVQIMWGL